MGDGKTVMASSVDVIPEELMRPEAKAQVIEWLRASQLPARFRRRLLQEWAAKVLVALTPEDYKSVLMK